MKGSFTTACLCLLLMVLSSFLTYLACVAPNQPLELLPPDSQQVLDWSRTMERYLGGLLENFDL